MESGETNVNDWQADQWNCPFTHLRYVEMSYFSGIQVEIDFISFMLLTSPVLTKMVINLDEGAEYSDKMKLGLVKQLLCLKRASTQAQIIFRDP